MNLIKTIKYFVIFAWLVSFYREYETGLWYWDAQHIGWGWNHPRVHVTPKFQTKDEAVSDWRKFLLSIDDHEWTER